ncbi:MAG: MBL fold metallo-hydrolase [Firmicutes bacterium]|jgi:L-ascorbate metabolism protein UlaG (beta-lactamase superfamily)|nr:MBL fold metallo-hydrolase [Bacillota bacterium]
MSRRVHAGVLLLVAVAAVGGPLPAAAHREISVKWFGHSCFLISSPTGVRILADPFAASVGYPVPSVAADVVTISHKHADHNNVSAAQGSPVALRGKGEYHRDGVRIYSVASFHDAEGGAKRGTNSIFVMEMDSIRLVHMGDIGHDMSQEQLNALGRVDVLLVR